jgi:hypothetical protein
MRIFLTRRERVRRQWRYFGRPFLMLFGIAALVGLLIGVVWVIAGLLNFHVPR